MIKKCTFQDVSSRRLHLQRASCRSVFGEFQHDPQKDRHRWESARLHSPLCNAWRGPGPRLNIKNIFSGYGDSHVNDKTVARPSYLNMGIPILVRLHLYSETAPRYSFNQRLMSPWSEFCKAMFCFSLKAMVGLFLYLMDSLKWKL